MATGIETMPSPEKAIVLDFPMNETTTSCASSPRIPLRIKKRLLEAKTQNITVEEIEAKLRHADLRRQQFYEKLSSKARPKPRSPSHSSSNEDDLGQRLEAKLQAAEQKRLDILMKAQRRLARLDELRQAAKTGVEMRYIRERERLGTKVERRVQQAEANRMLMLKAYKQRSATLRERMSQSLLRRVAREMKYKEYVRAAISQKRAAAEKKRLGLLEAERKRVQARVHQVLQAANSVSHQREIERKKALDRLEDRLQKAKRQRAEYLRQRGRQHNSRLYSKKMQKQADLLSIKLARCWRRFLRLRTTLDLAKEYDALKINENYIKSMPFDQLAHLIESPATLQAVKNLLDRLESRFKAFKAVHASSSSSGTENIDHLLERVATPKKRVSTRTSMRSREVKKTVGTVRQPARGPAIMSRYPVRVVLCAYMIVSHPDAVFSGQGDREVALAKSAEKFVGQFELLIQIILDGPIESTDEESDSMSPKRCTFRSQLEAFDKAWCSYLNCFVVWKVKDAQLLEEDLVRAACQLELSMIQKCKLSPEGDNDTLSHDMKAIQNQVIEDQKLLREKVHHLGGVAGIERMESALSETRSKYFQAMENGSPVGSPMTHILTSSSAPSSADPSPTASSGDVTEDVGMPSRVVRSLFREDDCSQDRVSKSSGTSSNLSTDQSGSSAEKLVTENELIVNEFLHEQSSGFLDRLNDVLKDNSFKANIRKTIEKAFWDSIMDSVKQAEPNYDRVVQLVREVGDEICELAPESWKQEVIDAVDLDILSQVLWSGNLDVHYLEKLLDFTLSTLQKLSSPAHEDEMKVLHQKLLEELVEECQTRDNSKCSHAIAMTKGLRFVLQQIQVLKLEISKARIKIIEPLLKGPAGLDYLGKAFTGRYGSPLNADTSLPLTKQWLLSVKYIDQEWAEHKTSISALTNQGSSSEVCIPSATMRTGGSFQYKTNGRKVVSSSTVSAESEQPAPECSGERLDLLLRLGLLKLISGIVGLTPETVPETFMLNLARLRLVQSQVQKIIVIATSILVCRQTLVMERTVANSTDMESILSRCTEQLVELLDHNDEAGIEEIVEIIGGFSQNNAKALETNAVQSIKLVVARMLAKSLQAGDPVFEKVSRAVYLALRGVVLGGSGSNGRKMAEMALRQVGAVKLMERVVESAKVVAVVASVSLGVHHPWYVDLMKM